MLKYLISFLFASFSLSFSCFAQKTIDKKAQKIIQECVAAHGGKNYKNVDVSFDFRTFKIRIKSKGSEFQYERTMQDSLKRNVHDVLNNVGFTREINNEKQALSQKDMDKYREGVNSVAYFVLLPYKLMDIAVNSAHVGTMTLDNQTYDKIKVWFDTEGGGKDHEDVFCYWINQKTHMLDYLAYTNGGPRFRKAMKRHTVNGIVFQDYENYEILDKTLRTDEYGKAFVEGKAQLLSVIEQTNYVSNH